MEALLLAGVSPNQTAEYCSRGFCIQGPALFYAGSARIVQLLLDAGADPEYRNTTSFTGSRDSVITSVNYPLERIVYIDAAAVTALIKAGANPNRYGTTSSQFGLLSRQYPVINAVCRTETLKVLIAAGADVNVDTQSSVSSTALHNAILLECPDSVRVLLQAGANPNIKPIEKGPYGGRPLRYLGSKVKVWKSTSARDEIERLLRAAGAKK